MIRIEAKNLQEAYSKAASELACSVTEITIEVIQHPSSGFLGMFQKNAIIDARKTSDPVVSKQPKVEKIEKKVQQVASHSEQKVDASKDERKKTKNRRSKNRKKEGLPIEKQPQVVEQKQNTQKVEKKYQAKEESPKKEPQARVETKNRLDEDFHKPLVDINIAVVEIRENINKLFTHSCFELGEIKVDVFNENTILIEFSGEDAALLIGKEGYRYKSLSYLLYNWINIKYNLNIRLEIAEFLKNQEEMIDKYLISVIERVNNNGRAQTKILDGVLVKIALEALRKEFPTKYVGIKSGREGGKFIVINDFNRKNQ